MKYNNILIENLFKGLLFENNWFYLRLQPITSAQDCMGFFGNDLLPQ